MDRTLRLYAPTGHLFAEVPIYYEPAQQVSARCTLYRPADAPEAAPELKIVLPWMLVNLDMPYRYFGTIEEIKAHDRQLLEKQLAEHMSAAPGSYTFEYDSNPQTLRYVASGPGDSVGIIDITFSFTGNTKHLRFISGASLRSDCELTSNSLETNIALIQRIPAYDAGGLCDFDTSALHRLG